MAKELTRVIRAVRKKRASAGATGEARTKCKSGKAAQPFPTQKDRLNMRPELGGKRARNNWPQ